MSISARRTVPQLARRRPRAPLPLSLAPAAVWLLFAALVPLGVFFVYGFWQAGLFGLDKTWTLEQYRAVLTDSLYRDLILRTILLGLAVSAIVIPLAYAAAYVITFRLRRSRQLVLFLVLVSMLASYLVRIYSWKLILGPQGAINQTLDLVGIAPQTFLLYGKVAVLITLTHILLPFAVLPIYSAMSSVDPDTIRASRDLGAGPVVTLLRVTLPLTWHGVTTAFLFTFILAAGDYVTPQLVGGGSGVMVGRVIYDQFGLTGNLPLASALAFSLLLTIAATIGLINLAVWGVRRADPRRLLRSRATFPTLAFARRALGRVPWGHAYVAALLGFLFLPLATVVLFSFNDASIAAFPIRSLTLGWYSELGSSDFTGALRSSLLVGVAVSVVALLIGVPAAFALARSRMRMTGLVSAVILLPVALPGVILGMAILTTLRYVGWAPSLMVVVVAQATYVFPFVVFIVLARLRNFDRQLEEAARDLGCTSTGALRRVTLRIIAPSVLGSALMVFALSMDEFVITNFVIGGNSTVPTLVWSLMAKRGIPPTVNAIATVMLLVSILALVGVLLDRRRRRRRISAVARAEFGGLGG